MGTPIVRLEAQGTGNSSPEFQYHSSLQSLLVATTANATVSASFAYGPYGETLQHSGAQANNRRRRYNDKHKDELSGLYYYGARYYDPISQVWTSADPLYRFVPDAAWDQPRRANLYSFDLGNPMRFVDPDGRDATDPLGPYVDVYAQDGAGFGQVENEAGKRDWNAVVNDITATETAKGHFWHGAAGFAVSWQVGAFNAIAQAGNHEEALLAIGGSILGGSAKPKPASAVDDAAAGVRSAADQAAAARAKGGGVLSDGAGATADELAASVGGPTAGSKVTAAERAQILAESVVDGVYVCWRCGMPSTNPRNMDIGHKNTSRSRGGNKTRANLACEGQACNRSAGNRGKPKAGSSCAERGKCGPHPENPKAN
jgi:RHS repeat-associated protein